MYIICINIGTINIEERKGKNDLKPIVQPVRADFSREPWIKAPKKSLKLTRNPPWKSQFLHFK
jgi:hypothetical protein